MDKIEIGYNQSSRLGKPIVLGASIIFLVFLRVISASPLAKLIYASSASTSPTLSLSCIHLSTEKFSKDFHNSGKLLVGLVYLNYVKITSLFVMRRLYEFPTHSLFFSQLFTFSFHL